MHMLAKFRLKVSADQESFNANQLFISRVSHGGGTV